MTSTFTVYWAGVGTVVVALVGGFGGGMLVADRLSSSGSVPAPGKSRLAQVMADYERPKPVHVETTESLQPAVPPKSVNEPKSGAEVLEVRNPPVAESALQMRERTSAPVAASVPAAVPSVPAPLKHPPLERALGTNAKVVNVNPTSGAASEPRRIVESLDRAETRKVARKRAQEPRKNASENAHVRRIENDGVRYVVRTRDGRQANAAEVEKLKAILRARHTAYAESEAPRMSYQTERRDPFGHLFRD